MATGCGTVLVVDDEPALRLLCRLNLEFEGFSVLEAATLAEARRRLDATAVDVVLLDVHVGEDDGRDLLDELRSQGSPARVVLLTGSVEVTAAESGADLVIVKPFDPIELVAAVRELSGLAAVDSSL